MSNAPNLKDDFKLVSYKKKTNKPQPIIDTNKLEIAQFENTTFNVETAVRRTIEAKNELLLTDFYESVKASLREAIQILGTPNVKEIVCFGLGKVGECMISRYQLALLLCLKDLYNVSLIAYDPIFTENERTFLAEFQIDVLTTNLEGKYCVDNCTIFFMPHCPKQLSNNLLWANWSLKLSHTIIIANSFTKIIESNTKRAIAENAGYLLNISPYVVELAVINSFKYFDIFNDTAIHIFPINKLNLISSEFWDICPEPEYLKQDVEFIKQKNS